MQIRVRVALLHLCFLLPFLLPPTAAAAATSVFGPETFTLGSGRPQSFDRTFDADLAGDCGGRATYVLSAVSDGRNGISSATVVLNGIEYLRERDFSNGVAAEIEVELAASNQLRIVLKGGRPGSSLAISVRRDIEGEETCGPRVFFTSPAQGAIVDTTILVTGQVVGPRDIGVAVNAQRAHVDFAHAGTIDDPFPWRFASKSRGPTPRWPAT